MYVSVDYIYMSKGLDLTSFNKLVGMYVCMLLVQAYDNLRQRTVKTVEKAFRQFAKGQYKEANNCYRHMCQTLALFDWIGRKYLKIKVDLSHSTKVLSLYRVSDSRLEEMLDENHEAYSEEKHKTEVCQRTREVLAFLKYIPVSDVDMEEYIEFVPIIL